MCSKEKAVIYVYYIAHIRQQDGKIQTVQEHLEAVRTLSEEFGKKIGAKYLAGLSGLLHDLGKNTTLFKDYIKDAVENPDNPPPRGSVDHSTAGGKLLFQQFYHQSQSPFEKLAIEWIAMCIISHHSGLRDFLTPDLSSDLLRRVEEKELPQFEEAVDHLFASHISEDELSHYFTKTVDEVKILLQKVKENGLQPIAASLVIKYIFSCLIDADRTNTRMFEENEEITPAVDKTAFFKKSYVSLMNKIHSFENSKQASQPINLLRSEMSNQCEEFAANPSGIYTLSIPTGGGKTLASLRYALKHSILHQKERIIYIVPYTTIIEQNATTVREILKDEEHILEHHSNVIEKSIGDDEDYDPVAKKLKLAKDNWDSPIIFTTMVQFLNVFYSKGTRNSRRLHQLANSVIIFDEVQSVPIKCISLFNEALNFLSKIGNSSIVLCTATQPALDFVENKLKISTNAEMIKNMPTVSKSFKRVNIIDKTTPDGLDASQIKEFILEEMNTVNSVLVILNTKTAVRKLFEQLNEEREDYQLFHLSTSMCATHRKEILEEVKAALSNDEKVICVSTQLIEAGVDISFECVIRSLAGLDSIAQAAGRCNRHGEDGLRNVYIIKSADEVLSKLKEIKIGGEKTKRILGEFKDNPDMFGGDLLSPEAMTFYFKYYFDEIASDLHYWIQEIEKNAFDLLNVNQDLFSAYYHKNQSVFPLVCRQSFATVESHFQVIDNPTKSIIVPYNDEAKQLMADLNGELDIRELSSLLKSAQQYVINVYTHEFDQLDKEGNIDLLLHGNVYALKEIAYSEKRGLDLKGEGSWSIEMI